MYHPISEPPEPPRRKDLRLAVRDYSREGPYFVTICVREKRNLLSGVNDDGLHLTTIGQVVRESWLSLPRVHPTLILDEFVIMPNHMHAIVGFVGAGLAPPGVRTTSIDRSQR